MKKEQVKSLFDSKFIKVVDIQYEEGKHYYNATRREMDDLPCIKSDEAFQAMVPDAVSIALILKMEDPWRFTDMRKMKGQENCM